MSKRTQSIGGQDEPSGSTSKKRRISETENSSASSEPKNRKCDQNGNANQLEQHTNDEMPPENEKKPNAAHGHRFQLKLLMLFCIRAINEGYEFYLGTELADQGKKFDDLIFNYKKGHIRSYKYLQAKSKLKEKDEKIEVNDLFDIPVEGGKKKSNGEFSLPKYFRSYLEIARRGDNIDSCIICTNIDFADKKDLQKYGIQVKEVQLTDPILKFEELPNNKIPKCYKIEITKKDLSKKLTEETTSKLLAKMLLNSTNKKIKLNSKSELIRNYHMALISENVIDLTTKKFHVDFIKGSNRLSEGAKELRQNLLILTDIDKCWESLSFNFDENFGKTPLQPPVFNYPLPVAVKDEEIKGFLDKLIFAVNTPNEGELDDVLKNEVGNYFTLLNTDLEWAYIMNEMVNWFKREENVWLSSEEAKELFLNQTEKLMELIRVNEISIDYQKQLKRDLMGLEFNTEAIKDMTKNLKTLFESNSSSVIIGTESPQHTAVKLVAAIKTFAEFKYDDSFLVTSSKRLEDEVEMEKFKGCLELKKDSHTLLVIVCDGEGSDQHYKKYAALLPEGGKDNKINKVVIICRDNTAKMTDEIKYTDLTDEFKQKILCLKISFQLKKGMGQQEAENNKITVGELIGDKPEEVIDSNSIQELMQTGQEIKIPSFEDTNHFEDYYIERQLEFPFYEHFYDQLANRLEYTTDKLQNEFVFDSQGNIKWLKEDDLKEKEKIWKEMKKIVKENSKNSPSSNDGATREEDWITNENRKGKVFILDGIAGTGKSTILSNYNEKIIQKNPDTWVIRIDLVDYPNELMKFKFYPDQESAIEFFVNILAEKTGPLARSLLTHRFQTDGRIVVMLDGFDEIDDEKREKVLQLITAIKLTNVDALYLTTRSHLKKELRDKLFQFSYTLKKFSKNDQFDCLSKYWISKLEMRDKDQEKSIRLFGEKLVNRLSTFLKDKEKDFIGIPLHCRTLAEIYETQLIDKIKRGSSIDSLIQDISKKDLDLTSLYSRFMEKKFEIYVFQKMKTEINSTIKCTKNKLEEYMRNLAIKTIVNHSNDVDVLLGKSNLFESPDEKRKEEKSFTDAGVCWGYLEKDDKGEMKFLHRTYADYLFAKYLHDGFLPEDDENCNKLLTSQPVRELIFRTIFVDKQFEGVRMFFNSFLIKEKVKPMEILSREIKKSYTILGVAIREQNGQLFTFLCDCLDLPLEKIQFQKIIYQMFHNLEFKNVSESEPNQEEMTKIIQSVIKILGRNPEMTKNFLNKNEGEIPPDVFVDPDSIVNALLFNECYSSHFKPFLELLSSIYCEDTEFENFLLNRIKEYKAENIDEYKHYISTGNLEKTLTILRQDLGRNDLVNGISHQISYMDA